MEVLHESGAPLWTSANGTSRSASESRTRAGREPRTQQVQTFATMTNALLELRDWLIAEQVSVVSMEATGDYWKPVYYLLEGAGFELMLVNARDAKGLPGRKTDVSDAVWLCQLTECGLLRASMVPPEPIRRLRDLTRYRTETIRERSREAQRLEKVLEDACVKLSVVATDILGVSGRAMIKALIDGERDPVVLAELARQRLRAKHDALVEALTGRFTDHHAFMCQVILARIDALASAIDQITARIEVEIAPLRDAIDRLMTIPGVDRKVASVVIAETGGDMTRFRTAAHLASWAGVCPGSHESGGIRKSGKTRARNKPLTGALGIAAMSAARTKDTYLSARYHRLAGRRGKQRALVALEHSILIAVWHMLSENVDYHDLGADHLVNLAPERSRRRAIRQLNQLGYTVTLNPIEPAA